MAEKEQAKKKGQDGGGGEGGGEEELLRHPVMAFPPFTPVLVTAQRIPFYAEPDENAQVIGEARMKEVVPVIQAQGPWLMTVCRFEEAWFQAQYVDIVEQDAPTVTFQNQEVVHQAFEEKQETAEPGRKVPTETATFMDQADGYGMLVQPNTTEELFTQAYAELVFAFEPNANMIGTYKHIMNVFSPDIAVELTDFIAIPAEVEAGGETGPGPLFPEEREAQGGAQQGGGGEGGARRASGQQASNEPRELGPATQVAADAASRASGSFGQSFGDVVVKQDPALAESGKRAAVADGTTIRVAPGAESDLALMLEELAHIVQHRNAENGAASEKAPRDEAALEAEAARAVEAASSGRSFEITGIASGELYQIPQRTPDVNVQADPSIRDKVARDPSVGADSVRDPLSHPYYPEFKGRVEAFFGQIGAPEGKTPAQIAEEIWTRVCATMLDSQDEMADRGTYSNYDRGWNNLESPQFLAVRQQFDGIIADLARYASSQFSSAKNFGFWSKEEGRKFGEKNCDLTLETSGIGALFDGIPTLDGANRAGWDAQLWGSLSHGYATAVGQQIAAGKTVHVCVGAGVADGNIWATVESRAVSDAARLLRRSLESVVTYHGVAATDKKKRDVDESKGNQGALYSGTSLADAKAAADAHWATLPEAP